MSNRDYQIWLAANPTDKILNKTSVRLCHEFAIAVRAFIMTEMRVSVSNYGDLRDQLARSSLSCTSNAVEGWSRYQKDARRMLFYAKGSGLEAVQQLKIAGARDSLIELGLEACRAIDQDLVALSQD